jgi:hypothetical protein
MVFGLVAAVVALVVVLAELEVNLIMVVVAAARAALPLEELAEQVLLAAPGALVLVAALLLLVLSLEAVAVERMVEPLPLVLPVSVELLYSPHNFWRTQI